MHNGNEISNGFQLVFVANMDMKTIINCVTYGKEFRVFFPPSVTLENHVSAKILKTTHTVEINKVTPAENMQENILTTEKGASNVNKETEEAEILTTQNPGEGTVTTSDETKTVESQSYCKLCNVKFLELTNLREHVEQYHSPQTFHCKFCALCFTALDDLQNHIITKHASVAQACLFRGYVYLDHFLL